jgi:asparagine synthase (glutamine-hydrolysing)
MCGIAGMIDLTGKRPVDPQALARMAAAILHRGPDESGFHVEPGIGLANRRLSIVGLKDGRQPIFNEDKSVVVVFNGEFFDYPEKKAWLASLGHRFATSCDTEILVHLYEEFGERMFDHLRGQFAFCLLDRRRRTLLLARDRIGICPLHVARRDDWLYFGSEIKAIHASGFVKPEADPRGLDHIFNFFAMATRRTAFAGVDAVLPGTYLRVELPTDGRATSPVERRYWDVDFPDAGQEYNPSSDEEAVQGFMERFERAVDIRLRADVPVVSYLSGGVDSTTVALTASRIRKAPIPLFTIQIPDLDETDRAMIAARLIGVDPTIVRCDSAVIANSFPALVQAADCPVMDTSCAALLRLAEEVHRQGFKVALTGEGADEALAGYPWFKVNRLMRLLDVGPVQPSNWLRWTYIKLINRRIPWANAKRIQALVGGPQAQLELYGLVGMSRFRLYSQKMWDSLGGRFAYEDLPLNLDRVKKWHRLNQSLYLGYKLMLPGLLLNHKGDRPAMHHSIETRYPFLDEDVIDYCANIHPRYKLKGLTRDKHLLRLAAAKMLPPEIADRPKAMFRAPFANTFFDAPPPWAEQLLSPESLARTGYFDPEGVAETTNSYRQKGWASGRRLSMEMGLTGVMTTQLWHHLFLGGGLCDLPAFAPPAPKEFPNTPAAPRPAAV